MKKKTECPLSARLEELTAEGFRIITHPGGRGNPPICSAAELKYMVATSRGRITPIEDRIQIALGQIKPDKQGHTIVVLEADASFRKKGPPDGHSNGLIVDPVALRGGWVHEFQQDRYLFGRFTWPSVFPAGSFHSLVKPDLEAWKDVRTVIEGGQFHSWVRFEIIGGEKPMVQSNHGTTPKTTEHWGKNRSAAK